MSIRKRLILSNAAMIMMPIIIIIVLVILLNIVFNGANISENNFRNHWNNAEVENTGLFDELRKMASLDQDKLFDHHYLDNLIATFGEEQMEIAIRKGTEFIYTTNPMDSIGELPPFGREGYDPAGRQFGENHYSIRQHDFYFADGTEGSIFLLNSSASFVKFARSFFPILFISLLVILVGTNILLAYFMSRSILRPVHQLADASAKISDGQLDFSVQAKGKDELARLVTAFDHMRQRLKESLELRETYENNRRELVANISHDLKTPVTSIIGYVEGIQDGVAQSVEMQERYLQTIHAKATYMNRLIEELSLFSKLDVKKVPFHFEAVNIHAFLTDYLDDMKDELYEKNVHITFLENNTEKKVWVDRDKLIRVFENIIYNSVKYMDKTPGIITISLHDLGEMMQININDNGPGVNQEELATIFNRFYRADPSRSTGGSGLGLAIASQIIEAHGGTIWAENLTEEGFSVHFTLKKEQNND